MRKLIIALVALALGLIIGCSSGGNSSPNPNATNTSWYQAGYMFGSAAGQDQFENGGPEAALVNEYAGANPCTEILSFGVGANSGVPSDELPPPDTSGNDAADGQWNNGCYAGIDAATGEQYPTNNGG